MRKLKSSWCAEKKIVQVLNEFQEEKKIQIIIMWFKMAQKMWKRNDYKKKLIEITKIIVPESELILATEQIWRYNSYFLHIFNHIYNYLIHYFGLQNNHFGFTTHTKWNSYFVPFSQV